MPYCPICKYEYQMGVSICPDCNEMLVGQLPEDRPGGAAVKPDNSWVGVCRVSGHIKSELATGALDSNNIPSIVISSAFNATGSHSGTDTSFASLSGGGDILMVPREFVQEAEIILEAILGEDFNALDTGR